MNMTQVAYSDLRKRIIDHRIAPGSKLDMEELRQELGFSRAPIADALNRLRLEGLVVSKHRVGTFAAEINEQGIAEVFEAREMLEHWSAVAIINNISNRQLDKLELKLEAAGSLLEGVEEESFDYQRFMVLDHEFHTDLIKISERAIFEKWFDELTIHMMRVRNIYRKDALKRSLEGQLEHCAILEAIRTRDVDRTRQVMAHHTQASNASAVHQAKIKS